MIAYILYLLLPHFFKYEITLFKANFFAQIFFTCLRASQTKRCDINLELSTPRIGELKLFFKEFETSKKILKHTFGALLPFSVKIYIPHCGFSPPNNRQQILSWSKNLYSINSEKLL